MSKKIRYCSYCLYASTLGFLAKISCILQIWRDYVEVKDELKPEDDKQERKLDQKPVVVTHVTDDLHVFVQYIDDVSMNSGIIQDYLIAINELMFFLG